MINYLCQRLHNKNANLAGAFSLAYKGCTCNLIITKNLHTAFQILQFFLHLYTTLLLELCSDKRGHQHPEDLEAVQHGHW